MKIWDARDANFGKIMCDECKAMSPVVVTFESSASAANGEAIVVDVCPDCLRRALTAITANDGPNSWLYDKAEKALRGKR